VMNMYRGVEVYINTYLTSALLGGGEYIIA
jgi:hypothetical protein